MEIDTEFYNVYEDKINEIINKRDIVSGIYHLNEEKVNIWVNNQLTERRKKLLEI
jgi:hypothetical protein